MNKLLNWFRESNRAKHLGLGALVGLGADDWYCAVYVGAGVSGAMEFKDRQWGGKWDWIDFGLTFAGVVGGYCLRWSLFG